MEMGEEEEGRKRTGAWRREGVRGGLGVSCFRMKIRSDLQTQKRNMLRVRCCVCWLFSPVTFPGPVVQKTFCTCRGERGGAEKDYELVVVFPSSVPLGKDHLTL
eukprot:Hpha_TRINITY_DN16356_c0_g2::TRINITY_DN16356_c0_g2_i1::g.58640::m.58640